MFLPSTSRPHPAFSCPPFSVWEDASTKASVLAGPGITSLGGGLEPWPVPSSLLRLVGLWTRLQPYCGGKFFLGLGTVGLDQSLETLLAGAGAASGSWARPAAFVLGLERMP